MLDFRFRTDSKSYEFCENIATQMAHRYRISLDEAVRRINDLWAGIDFEEGQEDDERRHELVDWWIDHIFQRFEKGIRGETKGKHNEPPGKFL